MMKLGQLRRLDEPQRSRAVREALDQGGGEGGGMTRPTIALIACSARKANVYVAPARDIYTGALFRASVRCAESHGWPWAVLSAQHRLLFPDEVIEPYDLSMYDLHPEQREAWARLTAHQIFRRCGQPPHVVLLAGATYCKYLLPELRMRGGVSVDTPLAGLGIGLQRQRLAQMTAAMRESA